MAKKKTISVESKEEVSRTFVDNDHVLITYSDGTTETRLV